MTNKQDGCFYIATVWRTNEKTDAAGTKTLDHYRAVERRWAESPAVFYDLLLEESDDDEITIGPIGVSQDQGIRE